MQAQLATSGIMNVFNAKEADAEWSLSKFKPSETGKWSHGYHRYPAKFIPQLVEKLIDEYVSTEDAHINDPFYGCGTTPSERRVGVYNLCWQGLLIYGLCQMA